MYSTTITQNNELHIFKDPNLDFCAIISLQNNGRGPAIGGCRMLPYVSVEAAIQEASRLAKAMSYKAALSELPHDGGKAVIIRSAKNIDHAATLKRFAECVHSLNGRYITTIDSGTTQADMAVIKNVTPFVTGYLPENTLENNTSYFTALGVYNGIKAALKLRYQHDNLKGLKIAIQGVGHVGYQLAKLLQPDGASLILCDTRSQRVKEIANELHAAHVPPEAIYSVPCDVFVPCALGQILNSQTVTQLNTAIIAGAANDQLASAGIAAQLAAREILYIPDYLINAGGLIQLALQQQHKNLNEITEAVTYIGQRILNLTEQAAQQGVTLFTLAEELAEKLINPGYKLLYGV